MVNRALLSMARVACALLLIMSAPAAWARDNVVKIGVLADQSGPYADITGKGIVLAAQMAIDEFGGRILGKPIELLSADHQNKTEVGVAIAQDWLNEKNVDVIADTTNSGLGLAVQTVVNSGGKGILLLATPNSEALIGKSCSPYSFMWATDSYAWATVGGRSAAKQSNTWFFIQIDWAAGNSAADNLQAVIEAAGGKVLGRVKHNPGATDFSSFLLQAQASGAKTVAFFNSGNDFLNAIRQAKEFGLTEGGQRLQAALTLYITDAYALGLDAGQGLTGVSGFEWNENPEAEAWSRKFFQKFGKMPTAAQIGQYSQVLHYLQAVQAAGTDDRDAVAAKMRELPVNDAFVKNGTIRKDGRLMHDIMLIEMKSPEESTGPWDLFKVVRTVSGQEAFRPLDKSECPLAH